MRTIRSLAALAALAPTLLVAQTYTATGGGIPDDGSTIDFPISVAGLPQPLDTVAFGLESVCFTITHTWISDMELRLVAPDGTSVLLLTGIGGDTDDFANTCLNTGAATAITEGGPPYAGSYRPMGQLGLVNNGQSGNGTWLLRIRDTYPFADAGTLLGFSLTFGPDPSTYYAPASTDLPIVIIRTDNDAPIPNDPKIPADMGIIDNGPDEPNHSTDPFNDFNGRIGIELRGNSSQTFPKKSYGLELQDDFGEDQSAPLLGMPSESDWILSANYSDKSLLNNPLTFDLGQRMGRYAPRWRHVELWLNGEYQGVYVLTEKIKRDGDRVDVARLDEDDLAGDSLTGGYIVKIDWEQGDNAATWVSDFAPQASQDGQVIEFLVDYPDEPLPQQAAYIEAYVDSFEQALAFEALDDTVNGYRHFLDVRSAIDLMLVNELARNVDGYRLSTFLHKDKASKGGKLVLGPLWDFDLAWRNADYCRGNDPTGWAYDFSGDCPWDGKQIPFWWSRFQEDPAFVDSARCRWETLRNTVFGVDRLHAWCDSMAVELAQGAAHNFQVWPILGAYVWPNPSPIPTTYAGEILELKAFFSERWQWLDANLPGQCPTAGLAEGVPAAALRARPNPFTDVLVLGPTADLHGRPQVQVLDALGRDVTGQFEAGPFNGTALELRLRGPLAPGAYTVLMRHADRVARTVVIHSR